MTVVKEWQRLTRHALPDLRGTVREEGGGRREQQRANPILHPVLNASTKICQCFGLFLKHSHYLFEGGKLKSVLTFSVHEEPAGVIPWEEEPPSCSGFIRALKGHQPSTFGFPLLVSGLCHRNV